jgi:putative inorganic carbon (HCO3(-)) transporter
MLTRLARAIMRWELLWLALLAPFLFFPGEGRGIAIVALPVLWLLRWVASRHFVPRTPLDGSLLLLLVMVAVSLWATFDPAFSLPKVTGVLLGIAFFYALVERAGSRRGILLALAFFLATNVAIAGISLFTTRWTSKFTIFQRLIALLPNTALELPGGPSDGFNPNGVAGALLFALPLLLVLVWPYRNAALSLVSRRWRWLLYPLLLFAFLQTAMVLLLTQSRGGYLGLAVGLLVLLLPRRRLFFLVTGIAAIVLVVALRSGPDTLLTYFDDTQTVEVTEEVTDNVVGGVQSFGDRVQLWRRTLYVIHDFPLTGTGMGTFRQVVPILYPVFSIPPDHDVGHAHNHLLAAAVDLGLPGLAAYLALWLGAAGMCWQIWHSSLPGGYRAVTLGLAAGLSANFIWGMTDANVLGAKAAFPFWLALGAVAALHRYSVLGEGEDVQRVE